MAAALVAAMSTEYEAHAATVGLGLQRWFLAAALLSRWDYVLLLIVLSMVFMYYILDFHIVGDVLRGWKGDAIGLYYDPKSPVSARLVAKCETLKKRYWPTPWLCSPHLQTLFLHFFGRSPSVEYQRQLYITSDGGTIALDWVKLSTFSEDGGSESRRKSPALDETPTAIIVPGLTSDSYNHYVKHIAGSYSGKGWRVLVANHRGLGGVSITSDQFYNAGWTEDLRKIILLVQQTYPKSPLLAVGTSIGANILVKYLGEEGPRTPLGGAVAICCPWDLLALYSKALTTGLLQYAQLHQTALARIIDWDLVRKAVSVRDFDNTITRHVGKYETVDTYYRRCSSTQFIESIAIPLLCISAEDDPICTKEAIPYDECRVNPNVILGVTGHGGHLAYFEGLDATSIWWVRAATEFARVLLSSSLMHKQSDVVDPKSKSNIDKGPFLTMTEGLQVAAQDSGYDEDFVPVAQENQGHTPSRRRTEGYERENGFAVDEGQNIILDKSVTPGPNLSADGGDSIVIDDYGGPLYRPVIQKFETDSGRADGGADDAPVTPNDSTGPRPFSTDAQLEGRESVMLRLRSSSEIAALRSALSQLLDQIPIPSSITQEAQATGPKASSNSGSTTCRRSQSVEVPVSGSVVAGFGDCVEATKDLLTSDHDTRHERSPVVAAATEDHHHHRQNRPSQSREEDSARQLNLVRDLAGLTSQNRRTLWLLTNAWRHHVVSNRLQTLDSRFERALTKEGSVSADHTSQPECIEPAKGSSDDDRQDLAADCCATGENVRGEDAQSPPLDPSNGTSIETRLPHQDQPKEGVATVKNIPEPLVSPTTNDEPRPMDSVACTEEDTTPCSTHGTDCPSSCSSSIIIPYSKDSDLDSVLKPILARSLSSLGKRTAKFPLSPARLVPSSCRNRIRDISSLTKISESGNSNRSQDSLAKCFDAPLENVPLARPAHSPKKEKKEMLMSKARNARPSLPLTKACSETIGKLSRKVNIFIARDPCSLATGGGREAGGTVSEKVGTTE